MLRSSWWIAAGLLAASGCAMIAGVDGDYTLGATTNTGGSNTNASTGAVAGNGGAVVTATGGSGAGPNSGGGGATSQGGGGAPATFQVACYDNGTLCAPGEVCCVTINTENNTQLGCAQPNTCVFGSGFEASCDGPEDCPNSICCGTHPPNLYWTSMACDPACNLADQFAMCGGATPGSQHCGAGTCYPSSDMPGYQYCNYP